MSVPPPPRFVRPALGFWEGRQTWWRPPPPPRPGAAASCGPHGPGLRRGRHGRGGPGRWGKRRERRRGPRPLLCLGGLRARPIRADNKQEGRPGRAAPLEPTGPEALGFRPESGGPGQGGLDSPEGTEPAILSGPDFCPGYFAPEPTRARVRKRSREFRRWCFAWAQIDVECAVVNLFPRCC